MSQHFITLLTACSLSCPNCSSDLLLYHTQLNMSAKRTALKLASKIDNDADKHSKYTTITTFSSNTGIINFSMSVIYTVCLFAVITYFIIGLVLANFRFNSTWEENNALHLNTQHYLYYSMVLIPITIGLSVYLFISKKYQFDKLFIMSLVPMILVCINYMAHYLEFVFVLHLDSFDMSFLPFQYAEWCLTTSMMLLVLSHIPSIKPQTVEVNPILNVEDETPKNKQTPVTNKYRREKKDKSIDSDNDGKGLFQVPIYSILQLNLLTFIIGGCSQILREEFKLYTLLGACITGAASIFFVSKFICDRFVASTVTNIVSKWFIIVWCYYPCVFFITRYAYYKQDNTLEHDLYFVGDLIGKTTLSLICSQITTRQLIGKPRSKKAE